MPTVYYNKEHTKIIQEATREQAAKWGHNCYHEAYAQIQFYKDEMRRRFPHIEYGCIALAVLNEINCLPLEKWELGNGEQ